MNPHHQAWRSALQRCGRLAEQSDTLQVSGRLTKVTGLILEAVGLRMPVGSTCLIELANSRIEAEVVGFSGEKLFLMPENEMHHGLLPGARVLPTLPACHSPSAWKHPVPQRRQAEQGRRLPVGYQLLGRVVDGAGRPLDRLGPLPQEETAPLQSRPFNPLERAPIKEVLDVGIRAINSLLTIGRGQRMGLFAGSGVGKSVLIGMMSRYTDADVIVVGLIGERGREVKEFITEILGHAGLARAVVVAAPADTSPLMRLQGASYATAIAEYFRDQGKNVLLIMDSLTRYAMAQREIGLAVGEPPTTKGYPPSVFARLPQLIERAGNGRDGSGSITAFYTVLVEGDAQQDPIGNSAMAILDGHIVLSNRLAEQGHYPAIDIESSISRVMTQLAPQDHIALSQRFKKLYAHFQRNQDLISVGAYVGGTDPLLDEAIALYPKFEQFLRQNITESESRATSNEKFFNLFSRSPT
jgi:flagellum-specific ATP synthase